MKELISSLASVVFLILFVVYAICMALRILSKRWNSSRHCKVLRNLAALMCVCALLICLNFSAFPLHGLFFPILTVPVFLSNAIIWHKDISLVQELEEQRATFMKTQPIDVEFKELN